MADGYTVLVIDDEPPILRFLRTSLAAAGYRPASADNAAAAILALAADKPDVVTRVGYRLQLPPERRA